MNYALGRNPVRNDKRTLRFPPYLVKLPPVKPAVDWTPFVKDWPMMRNDTIGDCTCAAAGHLIQLWTASSADLITPTDTDILAAYSAITGYDPMDPNTDNGANELDVLNYWKREGIAGHKIGAYAKVDHTDRDQTKIAIDMFAGLYIGFLVTKGMMNTVGYEWTLDRVNDGHVIGGHAVPIVGYDVGGVMMVTWGGLQRMTWEVWDAFVEESYAIISADQIAGRVSPSGYDIDTLKADLAVVTA